MIFLLLDHNVTLTDPLCNISESMSLACPWLESDVLGLRTLERILQYSTNPQDINNRFVYKYARVARRNQGRKPVGS